MFRSSVGTRASSCAPSESRLDRLPGAAGQDAGAGGRRREQHRFQRQCGRVRQPLREAGRAQPVRDEGFTAPKRISETTKNSVFQ